jgi:alanine dehydrogenase
MIFLTNQHIQQVLTMDACIDVIEEAYHELSAEQAAYRPRIDFYVPQEPHYYRWGTMEGASRKLGVMAIRMKSDKLIWNREGEFKTEDKYCIRPGTYCGLVFLLSIATGEPLALMNDGVLQHLRVGACAGLGAKYLSRQNSKVLGILGSGGMARTYAEAIRAVRPIELMNVFSPTKANRERYAEEMTQELGIEVQAVPTAAQAVRGADIVALATDSLIPVMNPEWVEPGMHVTNVRSNEVNQELLAKMDVIGRLGTATMMIDHLPEGTINGSDGMFAYCAGTADEKGRIPTAPHRGVDNPKIGTLPDLMAKRWAGRTNDQQITFLNNQGTQGLQFAAVGAKAYELATAKGLGHPLPSEWFLQDIRD